jgi:hypothetical protein
VTLKNEEFKTMPVGQESNSEEHPLILTADSQVLPRRKKVKFLKCLLNFYLERAAGYDQHKFLIFDQHLKVNIKTKQTWRDKLSKRLKFNFFSVEESIFSATHHNIIVLIDYLSIYILLLIELTPPKRDQIHEFSRFYSLILYEVYTVYTPTLQEYINLSIILSSREKLQSI